MRGSSAGAAEGMDAPQAGSTILQGRASAPTSSTAAAPGRAGPLPLQTAILQPTLPPRGGGSGGGLVLQVQAAPQQQRPAAGCTLDSQGTCPEVLGRGGSRVQLSCGHVWPATEQVHHYLRFSRSLG